MNQRTCDATRLSQFLGGDLSSHDELLLTGHLDQCTSCRDRLDELAADPASWTEAKEMLCDVVDQVTCTKPANNSDSLQIEQVLAQLGPTDDPESLGRIGGYEVTGVIGSGGMGVVLKAHDRSLDRVVAIKVMSPHLASSGSARQRFAREAKAAAAVLHPNVIAIHGVSNDQSLPYLVMPYVRGASLQKRIDADGSLPTIDILRIGSQVAAGLAAAHEQGLVHRDIKPANILLEQGVERVAITDFGLARAVDDASMTRSGVIAGTPQYMSPEQARGEAIDARSDLFSLGSLIYAMCTGHSPFRAETSYGVLHRITHDAPRAVRELNPNIPEWLEKIVMKLLSKSREDRFESAEEVSELLEGCLAHIQHPTTTPLPVVVDEATSPVHPQHSGTRRFVHYRKLIAAAFAFVLFFAGVLIVLETNKGTLTIECDADDVPIRIVQGKEVVERLTVLKSGTTTRLKAGEYIVEIDALNSDLEVVNNRVSISRGKREIVKIVLGDAAASPMNDYKSAMESALQSAREQGGSPSIEAAKTLRAQEDNRARLQSLLGKWEFQSVESNGVVTQYRTSIELTVTDNLWTVSNNMAGGNRFEIDGPKITFYGLTSTGNSSGVGGNTPSIALGTYELNGDTLTYAMTAFFPAPFLKELMGGGASQITLHPQGFDTKGKSIQVYRLRRSNRISSKTEVTQVERDQSAPQPEMTPSKADQAAEPASAETVSDTKLSLEPTEIPLKEVTPDAATSQPGKTLQQLQGKWRLTRQIDPSGDESGVPAKARWEFKGDRIIVREGGPGGAMLIEVDDSHSPIPVKLTLEAEDEIGLGLMSVEGDKAIFCLGKSHKAPEPQSRPEKLQWASGFWYNELTRMKPGETIVPLKPKIDIGIANEEMLSPNPSPQVPPQTKEQDSKARAVDLQNARSVIEAYVALALAGDVPKAAALAKNAAADPKRIRELPDFLNVQRLKIPTVYLNDATKPTRALATSEAVRLDEEHKNPDGRRDGFLVFKLESEDGNWSVIDIDFESETGAEKALKRFLVANPGSIGLPPQP